MRLIMDLVRDVVYHLSQVLEHVLVLSHVSTFIVLVATDWLVRFDLLLPQRLVDGHDFDDGLVEHRAVGNRDLAA